jgi:predicted enzyme related to lactoylglutathione lyase
MAVRIVAVRVAGEARDTKPLLRCLAVADRDARIRPALAFGGSIAVPRSDVAVVARAACLVDSARAHFGIFEAMRRSR